MDAAAQPSTQPPRNPRKRNRPAVSCGHCRARKVKCSRTSPCDACHRSGDASTCSYRLVDSSEQTRTDGLIARIDRLESLLASAMATNGQPIANPGGIQNGTSQIPNLDIYNNPNFAEPRLQTNAGMIGLDVNDMSKEFGSMKVDQAENSTLYLGGAHWASIMCGIAEFRNYLVDNHENLERNALEYRAVGRSPSLLRGTTTPASRDELESYVPSRDVTDRLVNRFFEYYGSIIPIIHEPTFRKEYHMYLIDSKTTKIIWLGLLFSLMQLAELSYAEEAKTEPSALAVMYKMRTVQCLVSSDYTTPVGYTIETLMLYIDAEWMTSQDPAIETSMVLGQAIRLAMRMGIHRDSAAFPNITPFRCEMRRRLWAAIHRADILYSFQLSLPPVIRQGDCDCGLPMNIRNEDFGEDTDLPPSRGLHEHTEASHLIVKYKLLLVIGNIIESTNIKGSIQIDTIEKLERSLSEARQQVPSYLQIAEDENLESLGSKKAQIALERVFQLGKCLLYRRFLHRHDGPSSLKYRGFCVDAAIKLLSYQSAIFMKPGSNFPENVKTRNMSTLISHDFFIAGMVVASDL